MKRIDLIFALLLISIVLLAGCSSGNSNEIKASLGKEFTLPLGQTAIISGENLQIKFEAMNGDSRCPKGVQCIRAGEAKCQMQITYHGSTSTVVYIDNGGINGYSQDFLNQYKVSFKLEPYPEAGKQVASNDYRLMMTVNK